MKPIVPKKNIATAHTADNLEATFQKAFITTTEPQTVEKMAETIEKVEKSVPKPKAVANIKGNTEGVVSIKKKEKITVVPTRREGVNRVTLDIPNDVFSQIESHKEATGQTMKFLVVSLLKKFFAENQHIK